jgi:hypothetical protein
LVDWAGRGRHFSGLEGLLVPAPDVGHTDKLALARKAS